MTIEIKETGVEDLETIMAIHKAAFGQVDEADLTAALLTDPTAVPVLSLLAIVGSQRVGHILFTAARIEDFKDVSASILAPLAVVPEAQTSGVGSALVQDGLARLKDGDTQIAFVLGDPAYYGRFGFIPALPFSLSPPYPMPEAYLDAWMVQALNANGLDRIHGQVQCAEVMNRPEYWVE